VRQSLEVDMGRFLVEHSSPMVSALTNHLPISFIGSQDIIFGLCKLIFVSLL